MFREYCACAGQRRGGGVQHGAPRPHEPHRVLLSRRVPAGARRLPHQAGAPQLVTLTPRSTRHNATAYEHTDFINSSSHQTRTELVTQSRSSQHHFPHWTAPQTVSSPSRARITSPHREIQEVSLNLSHQTTPPQSHLVTLHRPIPLNMTPQEASFHQQSYESLQPIPPQPYLIVSSPIPSHGMHSSLQMSPHYGANAPRSPHSLRTPTSLPYRPLVGSKISPSPDGKRYTPHPFQALPSSMMIRKPEPISWIKYPVEPHHIYPGPYAAVDVPFEDINNNPSSFEVPKPSKKTKLSSTWGPQKLKYLEKSRKCVRFASTWGPIHPGGVGEYATINPRKLTSRYVRPAIFKRSNLKE